MLSSDIKCTLDNYREKYKSIIQHLQSERKTEEGTTPCPCPSTNADETTATLATEPTLASAQLHPEGHFKISVYEGVVTVDPYSYWVVHALSRWWNSQSRESVFDHFNEEFWTLVQFLERCILELERDIVAKSIVIEINHVVEFLHELLPALVYLKGVYPSFVKFNALLQDIVDIVYIYEGAIERRVQHLTHLGLVEDLLV